MRIAMRPGKFSRCFAPGQRPSAPIRSMTGAAIAEGVVALYLIVTAAVLLILFLVNAGLVLINQQKVNAAAIETARFVQGQAYWIGMIIPDPTGAREAATLAKAKLLCNGILNRLGLPSASDIQIDIAEGSSTSPGIVTAKVSLSGIPLFGGGGVFPTAIPLTGTGAAAQESNPIYGIAELNFVEKNAPNDYYYVWVPIYIASHVTGSGQSIPIGLGQLPGQFKLVRIGVQGNGLLNRGVTDLFEYSDGKQSSQVPFK